MGHSALDRLGNRGASAAAPAAAAKTGPVTNRLGTKTIRKTINARGQTLETLQIPTRFIDAVRGVKGIRVKELQRYGKVIVAKAPATPGSPFTNVAITAEAANFEFIKSTITGVVNQCRKAEQDEEVATVAVSLAPTDDDDESSEALATGTGSTLVSAHSSSPRGRTRWNEEGQCSPPMIRATNGKVQIQGPAPAGHYDDDSHDACDRMPPRDAPRRLHPAGHDATWLSSRAAAPAVSVTDSHRGERGHRCDDDHGRSRQIESEHIDSSAPNGHGAADSRHTSHHRGLPRAEDFTRRGQPRPRSRSRSPRPRSRRRSPATSALTGHKTSGSRSHAGFGSQFSSHTASDGGALRGGYHDEQFHHRDTGRLAEASDRGGERMGRPADTRRAAPGGPGRGGHRGSDDYASRDDAFPDWHRDHRRQQEDWGANSHRGNIAWREPDRRHVDEQPSYRGDGRPPRPGAAPKYADHGRRGDGGDERPRTHPAEGPRAGSPPRHRAPDSHYNSRHDHRRTSPPQRRSPSPSRRWRGRESSLPHQPPPRAAHRLPRQRSPPSRHRSLSRRRSRSRTPPRRPQSSAADGARGPGRNSGRSDERRAVQVRDGRSSGADDKVAKLLQSKQRCEQLLPSPPRMSPELSHGCCAIFTHAFCGPRPAPLSLVVLGVHAARTSWAWARPLTGSRSSLSVPRLAWAALTRRPPGGSRKSVMPTSKS